MWKVEASSAQNTLYSKRLDIWCWAIELVKWIIFAYLYSGLFLWKRGAGAIWRLLSCNSTRFLQKPLQSISMYGFILVWKGSLQMAWMCMLLWSATYFNIFHFCLLFFSPWKFVTTVLVHYSTYRLHMHETRIPSILGHIFFMKLETIPVILQWYGKSLLQKQRFTLFTVFYSKQCYSNLILLYTGWTAMTEAHLIFNTMSVFAQ